MVDRLRYEANFRVAAGDQQKTAKPMNLRQIEQEGDGTTVVGAGPCHCPLGISRKAGQRRVVAHQPDRHFLSAEASGQRQRPVRSAKNEHPGGPAGKTIVHL
ncbi:hypothetical protein [Mesorhizobium japonicum]|uniref:hypothetical protein n=1 Tax=Mesorhizobium japonicum TaxID=2066070 RepID=UPI003B5A56E0